ncbi:MAG: hypothetical protein JNM25_14570 [Planctomycetes bacterium]|nr:hypothetical protein [Planctomycetota bacterium]
MRRDTVGVFAMAAVAACSSAPPATPEQIEQAEQRLLRPFVETADVGCGELQIDITGNFHVNVGQPAIDPSTQTVTREQAATYREIVWTNTTGDLSHAFVLTIGQPPAVTDRGIELRQQTRFRVLNQVRLRVHEDRRPLQLDVRAVGDVVLVRQAGGKVREVKEFVVSGGVASTR